MHPALKDEQSQGITIDTARCFFKTAKRHYIIIDAPGHIEFLKNMITGASRAEAALLVIDAKEGVQENSRRHGFMLSLLGIEKVVILINKMDLVNYSHEHFEKVKAEYSSFLEQIKVKPLAFVPISAREGDNLVSSSAQMPWYQGLDVLSLIDGLEKEKDRHEQPFRMPVQDIYKFTEDNDDRRIVAGTVETGSISVGDPVVFLPSFKKSVIKSIEGFNEPVKSSVGAGYATGFTLETQIYIKPGEIMCRDDQPLPAVNSTFRANLFWLGRHPMIVGKKYKMKMTTQRATVYLKKIGHVLDAAELTYDSQKSIIERHDVAECILQTVKPIAYDLSRDIAATGRFVIIDNYEIVGGGIITESLNDDNFINEHVTLREIAWEKSDITPELRAARFRQRPKFVVLSGANEELGTKLAKALEERLFQNGYNVYYLSIQNLLSGLDSEYQVSDDREENIRHLGELARLFTDAGLIFLTNISGLDQYEIDILKSLNQPNEILVVDLDSQFELNDVLNNETDQINLFLEQIQKLLHDQEILLDYYI